MPGIKPGMTGRNDPKFASMRPSLLNPLFAPVTSLPGVGPKQDKLDGILQQLVLLRTDAGRAGSGANSGLSRLGRITRT